MNKQSFLDELRSALSALPPDDVEKSIDFYGEMIDDRMEEGLSEEEAVAAVGTVSDIAAQILSETSLPKLIKGKVKPRRELRGWEIALIIIGFPLWLPLLFAGAAVIAAIYMTVFSVILAFWAVAFSFALWGIAALIGAFPYFFAGNAAAGALLIGSGLIGAGLSILLYFAVKTATKFILMSCGKLLHLIKTCFIGKGGAR